MDARSGICWVWDLSRHVIARLEGGDMCTSRGVHIVVDRSRFDLEHSPRRCSPRSIPPAGLLIRDMLGMHTAEALLHHITQVLLVGFKTATSLVWTLHSDVTTVYSRL